MPLYRAAAALAKRPNSTGSGRMVPSRPEPDPSAHLGALREAENRQQAALTSETSGPVDIVPSVAGISRLARVDRPDRRDGVPEHGNAHGSGSSGANRRERSIRVCRQDDGVHDGSSQRSSGRCA